MLGTQDIETALAITMLLGVLAVVAFLIGVQVTRWALRLNEIAGYQKQMVESLAEIRKHLWRAENAATRGTES